MTLPTDEIVDVITKVATGTRNPFPDLLPDNDIDLDFDPSSAELDFWGDDEDDDEEKWWFDSDIELPSFETPVQKEQAFDLAQQGAQAPETMDTIARGLKGTGQTDLLGQTFSVKRWMSQHENGRIPDKALASIGNGHKLRADAAAAWKAMVRAAAKQGVHIGTPTDSYRSFEAQVRLAQTKGLYSQGGLAAKPGTSDHGWGIAVDAADEGRSWIAQHGARWGWVNDTPGESWHFGFKGWDGAKVTAFNEPKRRAPRGKREPDTAARIAKADLAMGGSNLTGGAAFISVMGSIFGDEEARSVTREPRANRAPAASAGSVTAIVKRLAKKEGWTGKQWDALYEIVSRESGWNPEAQNPTSTAFGLFQFLDSTWNTVGFKKTSDPLEQAKAGLRYIRQRYGSPLAALAFHDNQGWY